MQKTVSSNPMEKTTSICCAQNASGKDDKGGLCLEDCISGFPNVILVSILSLLTMKEAGRSSLLSKRWRHMWTYIAALNFDASHIIDAFELGVQKVVAERPLYLSWVNQVVKSHNAPTIDEFRVHFDLDVTCRFDIDNWLGFAIEKRVKSLALELRERMGKSREEGENYNFPNTNLLHSKFFGFTNCISLTNLVLSSVDVNGQVLEYLLINCPFLEQLSVEESESLVNLKVPDLAVKLKRLEINLCFNVKSIEIYAKNLVSFKYFGDFINMPFKNAQEPVDLFIGGEYCNHLICNFFEISSYLSQLESLTLMMVDFEKNKIPFAKFPVFNKLKQLEWKLHAHDGDCLLIFTPLVEACPFLYKFVLEIEFVNFKRRREWRSVKSWPHQYLKVVEFIGFVGEMVDLELAMYLIKSAPNLEKITFDVRTPTLIGTSFQCMETKQKKVARKRAEKLRTKLPIGATLVIL